MTELPTVEVTEDGDFVFIRHENDLVKLDRASAVAVFIALGAALKQIDLGREDGKN